MRVNTVLGDAVSKLYTFVWILSHVSKSISSKSSMGLIVRGSLGVVGLTINHRAPCFPAITPFYWRAGQPAWRRGSKKSKRSVLALFGARATCTISTKHKFETSKRTFGSANENLHNHLQNFSVSSDFKSSFQYFQLQLLPRPDVRGGGSNVGFETNKSQLGRLVATSSPAWLIWKLPFPHLLRSVRIFFCQTSP